MLDSKDGRRHPAQILFDISETDRVTFFERARRFSQRLKRQPNLVADADIHELLGEEVDPAKVRSFASIHSAPSGTVSVALDDQSRASNHSRPAALGAPAADTTEAGKRLRRRANRALNTRLFAPGRILDEVDAAIAGVVAAPGRTNRLSELEQMQQSIEAFRTAIGWPRDPVEPLPEIDPEIFRDLLLDSSGTPDEP